MLAHVVFFFLLIRTITSHLFNMQSPYISFHLFISLSLTHRPTNPISLFTLSSHHGKNVSSTVQYSAVHTSRGCGHRGIQFLDHCACTRQSSSQSSRRRRRKRRGRTKRRRKRRRRSRRKTRRKGKRRERGRDELPEDTVSTGLQWASMRSRQICPLFFMLTEGW